VGTGIIAAADEDGHFFVDGLQGVGHFLPFDAGRIVCRPDDHEVVVHNFPSVDAEAGLDVFFFGGRRMHKQYIRIAVFSKLEGLAGAGRHPFEFDAGGCRKFRSQIIEQAGIVGARGRCHQQLFLGSLGRENNAGHGQQQGGKDAG